MPLGNDPVKVGYRYYLGLHKVICYGPVDEVSELVIDGRQAWSGSATGGPISIYNENLFGGEEREGGVSGVVDVDMGKPDQQVNTYLNNAIPGVVPAYRGVLSLIWNRLYIGTNPYLKPWAVKVRRTQILTDGGPQWDPSKADIDGALNAVHIIRECITNLSWGMGHDASKVDETTFLSASATLYAEGFGLSIMWSKQDSFENFLKEILRHISGKLSVSPITGKFELHLVRKDYVVSNLQLFDESNIVAIESFERRGWSETVNEITVLYTDQTTGKEGTVTVQDLANIQIQGGIVGQKSNYVGIPNADLATRVAQRDLNLLSKALAKVRLVVNRSGHDLTTGGVIRLSWGKLGLVDLPLRVLDIDYGLAKDGKITITALEDEFDMPVTPYTSVQGSGWLDPRPSPVDANNARLDEASYWEVHQRIPAANIAQAQPNFGLVVSLVQKPISGAYNYNLYTKVGAAAYQRRQTTADFCVTAELVYDTPAGTFTNITYTNLSGALPANLANTHAYLGNELIHIITYDAVNKTLNTSRGVADTVPVHHPAGTIIWLSQAGATDGVEYTETEVVYAKAAVITGKGALDVNSATAYSQTMTNRYERPYPPGNFKIDGLAYPDNTEGGEFITWSHRDRTQQTAYLITQSAGNIGPEAGTTYTLTIKGDGGALLRQVTGLTDQSYSYTVFMELSDIGGAQISSVITYSIHAVVNGLVSHQEQTNTSYRPSESVAVLSSHNSSVLTSTDVKLVCNGTLSSNNARVSVVATSYSTITYIRGTLASNSTEVVVIVDNFSGGSIIGENVVGENSLGE